MQKQSLNEEVYRFLQTYTQEEQDLLGCFGKILLEKEGKPFLVDIRAGKCSPLQVSYEPYTGKKGIKMESNLFSISIYKSFSAENSYISCIYDNKKKQENSSNEEDQFILYRYKDFELEQENVTLSYLTFDEKSGEARRAQIKLSPKFLLFEIKDPVTDTLFFSNTYMENKGYLGWQQEKMTKILRIAYQENQELMQFLEAQNDPLKAIATRFLPNRYGECKGHPTKIMKR